MPAFLISKAATCSQSQLITTTHLGRLFKLKKVLWVILYDKTQSMMAQIESESQMKCD